MTKGIVRLGHAAVFAFAAASAAAGGAVLQQDPAPISPRESPPGEGVLCLWVYTGAAAEVGRRCRTGQNPELQAELDSSVERFEAYVLSNSNATPEQVAEFKREQGMVGAPEATVCSGDAIALYNLVAARGADRLRSQVDALLARPGAPSWGDCP